MSTGLMRIEYCSLSFSDSLEFSRPSESFSSLGRPSVDNPPCCNYASLTLQLQKGVRLMSSQKPRVAVRGSERVALQGAQIGAPDPNERIEVTVRVRRRNPLPDSALLEARAVQPEQRRHLSREEFEATYGADPDEIAKVEEFAHEHGLTTVEASGARRSVILAGTVAAMSEAFGVYLAHYQTPAGMHRGRTGVVTVPEDLAEIIEGVFGLDNRPQAKPHFRRSKSNEGFAHDLAQSFSYSPDQLA